MGDNGGPLCWEWPPPLEPSIPQRRRLPAPVGHGLLQVIHIKGAVRQAGGHSHRSSSVKELTPRSGPEPLVPQPLLPCGRTPATVRDVFVIIYESQAVERST